MKQINTLVGLCVQKGYISQDEAPWLQYALEKRIASLIAFIPLVIIGFWITAPATMCSFFITFCSLRTRTNGFHAKSVLGCILYSILGEILFLKIIPSLWNNFIVLISLIVSIILIWVFAPYNHPDMGLSSEEVVACAKSAKCRLILLLFAVCLLFYWRREQLAVGIILGIIMTASTLVMAYCLRKAMHEEGK